MQLLFERSRSGRSMEYLPPCDTEPLEFAADALRSTRPDCPSSPRWIWTGIIPSWPGRRTVSTRAFIPWVPVL